MPSSHTTSGPASVAATIRTVADAIGTRQPLDQVLQRVAEGARNLVPSGIAAVVLRTPDGLGLTVAAVHGEDPRIMVGMRFNVAGSFADGALASRRAVVHDAPVLPAGPSDSGTGTMLVAPAVAAGSACGAVLLLRHPGSEPFGGEDVAWAEAMASLVPPAIEAADLARRASEQSRELELLYDAARHIGAERDPASVFEYVIQSVTDHFQHRFAVLLLYNDDRSRLIPAAQRGLPAELLDVQLPAGRDRLAQLVANGNASVLSASDIAAAMPELTVEPVVQSALAAPLRSPEESIGLVVVGAVSEGAYRTEDLDLLVTLLYPAGTSIHNAFLFADLERRSQESAGLYELSVGLGSTNNASAILETLCHGVDQMLQTDGCAVLLHNDTAAALQAVARTGVCEEALARCSAGAGAGIPGWVYQWRLAAAVPDISEDERNASAPIDAPYPASVLCTPFGTERNYFGVLTAVCCRRRAFTAHERQLFDTMANHGAVAYEHASLYQDARRRSQAMRRYFNRVAETLGSAVRVDDLPAAALNLARAMLQASGAVLYSCSGDDLTLAASAPARQAAPSDLTRLVARRGRVVLRPETADEPSARPSWDRRGGYLGVPLRAGRRTVGVMEFYSSEPGMLGEAEARLVAQFARRVGLLEYLTEEAATNG